MSSRRSSTSDLPVTRDAEGARGHPAVPVTHVLGNPDVRVRYLQRAGFHIASGMAP